LALASSGETCEKKREKQERKEKEKVGTDK
jgi:hypothetical protein